MKLDDILNEKLKKVKGKWALVSKSDPDKVLQYYHGPEGQKPSKEWEKKVERRVHAFSESISNHTDIKVDFGKLPNSTINTIIRFVKGPFGHMTDNQSARWLDHAKVIQLSRHNTLLRVKTSALNNVLRTLNNYNVKYEIVKDEQSLPYPESLPYPDDLDEAESLDKTVDRMRNLDIDDIEHLKRYSNPQLKDWLKRLTAANKNNIGSALNTLDSMGPIAKPFAKSLVQKQFPGIDDTEFDQAWKFWQETDPTTRSAVTKGDLTTLDPRDEHGFVKEADDYDAWLEKAKKRAEKQAAKKRAELQQVMKGIETDPEKLALQGTIQAARGELSKRKREALKTMAQLKQVYSEFSDEELDKIIGRYSKGPGAGSDFVEWLKSIKQEREDERQGVQQRQDVFRSVVGPMQGNQSQKTAPAADKPWTQLGMTRDEFRKILNNPQHPRHREIKQLHDQYKQVDEDLTRRDFLKGVGAAALGGAALAAMPKQARADWYKQYLGGETSPLVPKPALDINREWNRVGINQQGNQFSIVLHKKHGLYLYFVVSDFVQSPYVVIELERGERYKVRRRILKNDTFTVEDRTLALMMLNYDGPFKVYSDNDVYQFNVTQSPESRKLLKWFQEGTFKGL